MPKINFITHFFLEILHFKESCNFCNREPEFCQIQDWWWNTSYKINFHFGLLPSKTKDKFSLKIQKTLFWGHFGPFLPKLGQKWIFLVKKDCQFLNIPIIYHRAKNQKKLLNHFWEKGQTGWQTNRQINGYFIQPSIRGGSKKWQINLVKS